MATHGKLTRILSAAAVGVALLVTAACREDMHNQPKFKPLRINPFYADERASRPVLVGTVARGQLREDQYFYTGKINGKDGDVFPFAITPEVLARGQERFNIYCTPCHSRLGDGNGMIVQRGFKRPPSFHEQRLIKAPVGHFFDVMTNGWGSMSDYSSQVPVADRWKIAAYIRALQLTQAATPADVPAGMTVSNQKPQFKADTEPPMGSDKATHGEAPKGPQTEMNPR
ncbi:MAG TPA: cytochrome c [Candidatus Acidoferrales bacterium]|nr:cytochrome c [Candidatus Acidoferrales bacterium]